MKLLLIIPYFFPKVGGLENYALHIIKGLVKTYHWNVVVVTTNHENKKYKKEQLDGITVYRLPTQFKLSNTPISMFWYGKIKKIVMQEKPDIINGHTPVPFISDIGAHVASSLAIPYVLTYQNDLIKGTPLLTYMIKLYYKYLAAYTFRYSQKIIASSQYYADHSLYLKDYMGKIEIVPPGVSLSRFDYKNLKKEKLDIIAKPYVDIKIILFIGQLDKTHTHKGLSYLLLSLPGILKKFPNTHLIVIGKGDNIEEYKRQTQELHISDYVTYTGFITDEDLPYYYNISHVVVLPSYNDSEGFGMILIEAGAAKKPVVASRVGGIPSVINDKVTGFLTPPQDSASLSNALITLLSDQNLAISMGENNYLWVKEHFTWDQQIKKTHAILIKILS